MEAGQLGFTFHQRKWAELALNKDVEVFPYDPTADPYPYISTVKLEVRLGCCQPAIHVARSYNRLTHLS
jgi:hypothetical protein